MVKCSNCFYLCKSLINKCPYYWPEDQVTAQMSLDRMQGVQRSRWDYLTDHNREVERALEKLEPSDSNHWLYAQSGDRPMNPAFQGHHQ